MMKRRLSQILIALTLGVSIVHPVFAQDNSLVAPEVLDLDDPFARDIKRASELATGGVDLPIPSGALDPDVQRGAALDGVSDRRVAPASLYRVVGLAVAGGRDTGQIYSSSNQMMTRGNKPKLPYIRLGSYQSEAEARQVAIDLRVLLSDMLGAHFILRQPGDGSTILDIGPAPSIEFVDRYCEIIRTNGRGLQQDCYAELEYPEIEPIETFTSTAMLRLARTAIRELIQDQGTFDLEDTSNQTLLVKEGDMLGVGSHMVTKIVSDGVMLVSEEGNIDILSLNYLPESAASLTAAPAPAETLESDDGENNNDNN